MGTTGEAVGAPPHAGDGSGGGLPAYPTPLIGREREVAAARRLLGRAGVRLLTLTGPPDVGKTRLGLAVAAALRARFAHGSCFVDLAPLGEPALVLPTIARRLGLREAPGRPLADALAAYLAPRQLLLVLDNLEHLLPAAPAVAGLLAGVEPVSRGGSAPAGQRRRTRIVTLRPCPPPLNRVM